MIYKKNLLTGIFIFLISFVYCQENDSPIDFLIHKVKKGETIYGISKKYDVSILQIEKYNNKLRKGRLKRKMQLRIPIYSVINPKKIEVDKTEKYIVSAKETKWRIAYTHGITVSELERLNPEIVSGLKEGDVLRLPIETNNKKRDLEEGFYYYKVKSKEGYYRIEMKTGIKKSILDSLNPYIELNGLQEGMILKLPKKIYNELKTQNDLLIEKINLEDSTFIKNQLKLVFFLPIKLSAIEFDSIEKTNRLLKRRNLTTISLDFYSGSLLAMEKAIEKGINVNARIYDTENKIDKIKDKIDSLNIDSIDAIIGPIIPKNFDFVSSNLNLKNIPKISPLSYKPVKMNPGVFQSVTPKFVLRKQMKIFLKNEIFPEDNILIISDSLNRNIEKQLNEMFPSSVNLRPEKEDYLLPELVDSLIVDSIPNKIILETERFPLISSVSSQIRAQLDKETQIDLFTTYHGTSYENSNLSKTLFSDLGFIFTSDYFPKSIKGLSFNEKYFNRFGIYPNKIAIKAYDLVIDIILRIATQNNMFTSVSIGETEYINNKFNYNHYLNDSYINQAFYLLKHDEYELIEINR
ncbi:MAG: hypothetical protein CMC79_03750 [Flavobacteriaceae bacterium]|nr:hypothetical protein [Flavobacteriaceae bacterium]|tara:strand:- start:4815 stop:6548 length:1734 start_codon:yes stop_codon:yes gene_type:complete